VLSLVVKNSKVVVDCWVLLLMVVVCLVVGVVVVGMQCLTSTIDLTHTTIVLVRLVCSQLANIKVVRESPLIIVEEMRIPTLKMLQYQYDTGTTAFYLLQV
jgi:hypothetical protein